MSRTTPEQFIQLFHHEATDLLASLEASLLVLEKEPTNPEAIQEAFRCVHSIKGAASSVGLAEVSSFSHAFEYRLGDVRNGRVKLDSATAEYLLGCCDTLATLVHTTAQGLPAPVGWDSRLSELAATGQTQIVPLPTVPPERSLTPDEFEMLSDLYLEAEGDLLAETVLLESKRFRECLDAHPDGDVVLDLRKSETSDSSGVNLVVGVYKECLKRRRSFRVEGVQPNVLRLFRLLTLDRIIEMRPAA